MHNNSALASREERREVLFMRLLTMMDRYIYTHTYMPYTLIHMHTE
jgi:hypothetical protein